MVIIVVYGLVYDSFLSNVTILMIWKASGQMPLCYNIVNI